MTVGQLKRLLAEYDNDDDVMILDSEIGEYISIQSWDIKVQPAESPKSNMCQYDEAFTIADMLEETNRCRNCVFENCPNCGKSPV